MKLFPVLLLVLGIGYSSEYSDKEIIEIIDTTAYEISNYVSSNYENHIFRLKEEVLEANEATRKEFLKLTNEYAYKESILLQKHALELKSLEVHWKAKVNKSLIIGGGLGIGISSLIYVVGKGFEFTPIQVKF